MREECGYCASTENIVAWRPPLNGISIDHEMRAKANGKRHYWLLCKNCFDRHVVVADKYYDEAIPIEVINLKELLQF